MSLFRHQNRNVNSEWLCGVAVRSDPRRDHPGSCCGVRRCRGCRRY